MLKACFYRCIDAEVRHDTADHHIFFALFRQIFQQTALFLESVAYSLDEPFFGLQWCKLRIDIKLIIPDGETGAGPIIMLDINDFNPLLTGGPNQFLDVSNKLFERIQALIHDTFLCIHNQ